MKLVVFSTITAEPCGDSDALPEKRERLWLVLFSKNLYPVRSTEAAPSLVTSIHSCPVCGAGGWYIISVITTAAEACIGAINAPRKRKKKIRLCFTIAIEILYFQHPAQVVLGNTGGLALR